MDKRSLYSRIATVYIHYIHRAFVIKLNFLKEQKRKEVSEERKKKNEEAIKALKRGLYNSSI